MSLWEEIAKILKLPCTYTTKIYTYVLVLTIFFFFLSFFDFRICGYIDSITYPYAWRIAKDDEETRKKTYFYHVRLLDFVKQQQVLIVSS